MVTCIYLHIIQDKVPYYFLTLDVCIKSAINIHIFAIGNLESRISNDFDTGLFVGIVSLTSHFTIFHGDVGNDLQKARRRRLLY